MRKLLPLLLSLSIFPLAARANITLLDKDDWKVMMGGFVETDMFNDSTRSLTEVVGSNPIAPGGTYNGDNGRTQFSIRNSRLDFTVLPPVQGEWKTKGYLEFDLLGYDPSAPGTSPLTNTESGFFTNPTLRVRHAFVSAERDGWTLLVGQYWTLFGWDPAYVLSTASVAPVTATIYERTPQFTAVRAISFTDENKLQAAISISRPAQRDSSIPDVDAGARMTFGGRRAGYVSPNGDISAEPMSLALSGTFREFDVPAAGGAPNQSTHSFADALAVNGMLPILASSDGKSYADTLAFSAEFTTGSGYGDMFPGWGGFLQLPTGAAGGAPVYIKNTDIDPGLGGYDASGAFQPVHLQTWNVELQYHFPADWNCFTTWGYGQLYSDNATAFVSDLAVSALPYDRTTIWFGNFFHDFTSHVRVALEYDRFGTRYGAGGVTAYDNRVQASTWIRF